jgi:hypothetical protein
MHISQVTRPWLDALDWIQRTGWRSRVHDVAVAKWIFDGWWQQVEKSCCASEKQNLCGFIKALEEVFHDSHDADAVRHLCFLFHEMFESEFVSRRWAALKCSSS